ncbi:hypothetical protein KDA82_38010, partial [Streptomyces daliensis]|nr:hypothetical protein [Streptomyces daliensis]
GELADKTGDLGKGGDAAKGAVKGAEKTAGKAVGKATGVAGDVKGKATEATKAVDGLKGGELPQVPAVGAVSGLPTKDLPAQGLPTDALRTDGLPAAPSAPGTGNLFSGIAAAGLRPEQLTTALKGGTTQQVVKSTKQTVAPVQPVVGGVGGTGASVLPPVAQSLVVRTLPVTGQVTGLAGQTTGIAEQAAGDAGTTADHAVSATVPYVAGITIQADGLAQGVTGDVTGHVSAFGQSLAEGAD